MSIVLGYRFAAIPEWVLYHADLTGEDVRVFGALARCGENVIPKLSTIAERTHLSDRTVRRCRERLEAVGALWVETRHVEGRQTTNRYHLAGDEPVTPVTGRADTDDRHGADTGDRGEADTGDRQKESKKEREQEEREEPQPPCRSATERDRQAASPPAKREVVDEDFDKWWLLYPKKVNGKGQAREKWRKMLAKERVAAFEGVERHVAWWTEHETDAAFIPAGGVWLNQRRWEDDEPRSVVELRAVGPPTMMDRVRAKLDAKIADKTQTQEAR